MTTYALVGSVGAVSTGAVTTAVTPAWGTSETRAAGNLLICWVASVGATTAITTPAGWSGDVLPVGANGVVCGVYRRIATGADAAPTVAAITGAVLNVQLAEFSGNASGGVFTQGAGASTIATSPLVDTLGTDPRVGNLFVFTFVQALSGAGVTTTTHTLNNGMVANVTSNDASSVTAHYSFGWAVSATIASAPKDSVAFTTATSTGAQVACASYRQLPPPRMLLGTGI